MYKITLGQLITMWIFGIFGIFTTLAIAFNGSPAIGGILSVGIPFFLVFYTLGWNKNRN